MWTEVWVETVIPQIDIYLFLVIEFIQFFFLIVCQHVSATMHGRSV
jgi:hypothetical protein